MLNNGLLIVYLNNIKVLPSSIFSAPTKHSGMAITQTNLAQLNRCLMWGRDSNPKPLLLIQHQFNSLKIGILIPVPLITLLSNHRIWSMRPLSTTTRVFFWGMDKVCLIKPIGSASYPPKQYSVQLHLNNLLLVPSIIESLISCSICKG
jgi:hypothetical protein